MKFAICLQSKVHDDLEHWKLYRIIPDKKADQVGCLRVIDESGEDYLYPAKKFLVVDFSEEVQTKLLESIQEVA